MLCHALTILPGPGPVQGPLPHFVKPQAVQTKTLPQLGEAWRTDNPYRSGDPQQEPLRITRFATLDVASPLLPARGADESELAELLQNALDAIRRRGELQQIFAQYGVSLKTL
jgi:hypothetical protein